MNITLWLLAGAIVGWAGAHFFDFNQQRGNAVAMVIGAVGALLGGDSLAPLLSNAAVIEGHISIFSLVIAMLVAAACVVAGDMVSRRFGI
jgi:uncharacterized membrane protein YeaQ/YmgE (transglycosylase-associated protein family)